MAGIRAGYGDNTALEIAVLASYRDEVFGIELASRSLVRFEAAERRYSSLVFNPFAQWRVTLGEDPLYQDPARPEYIEVREITPIGQIRKRRAITSLCNACTAPETLPILNFNGPSIAYSNVTGTSPSVSIIRLGKRQAIRWNSYGELTISFPWGPIIASVPIVNETERDALGKSARPLTSDKEIASVLGYHPRYLVVGLDRPVNGYCKKLGVGLLPHSITRNQAKLFASTQLEHQLTEPRLDSQRRAISDFPESGDS